MKEMTENLSLKDNIAALIIKALNKFRYEYQAAQALGVKCRRFYKVKKEYGVVWDGIRYVKAE